MNTRNFNEANDIKHIQRLVIGFSKTANISGQFLMEVEYVLPAMNLDFLRTIFGVDPNDPDPVVRDIVAPLRMNSEQAKALQPFLKKNELIDLDKYNFSFDTVQAPGSEEYWRNQKLLSDTINK
jgi:hypothetical protein